MKRNLKEGFDKPGVLVVLNAGTTMKPQHSQLCDDFMVGTKLKTDRELISIFLPDR